ncbi:hypothetical protein CHS0354_041437 [Potamilus streckersoni]|uniref:C1q domain-containing protein n=1 Tax=Potamilus streckersoni TaxID=2493646 RepID=A0AAE0TA07_9BIVA|nr:hypothetical protein CHS0354_041437 [Potamilus streckersoni]
MKRTDMSFVPYIFLMFVSVLDGLILNPEEGGQTDTSFLQQLLFEEKQLRMNLEQKVQDLNSRVASLEHHTCESTCEAKQKSVAFMAQLSASIVNPVEGHVIVFDDIITNEGAAYNNVHGIFTAPVNGTYEFSLIVSSPPNPSSYHEFHLFLMRNNVQIGYVFLDHNTQFWLRRITTATVHLKQTDEVWVQVAWVKGDHEIGGCCFHSLFGGFLIHAD